MNFVYELRNFIGIQKEILNITSVCWGQTIVYYMVKENSKVNYYLFILQLCYHRILEASSRK